MMPKIADSVSYTWLTEAQSQELLRALKEVEINEDHEFKASQYSFRLV
jgi:hypothetical protein